MTPYDSPRWHEIVAAIRQQPGEDGLRWVAADWLEEQGEAERAEFIRVQLELAAIPLAECDRIYPGCTVFDNRVMGHNHKCRGYEPEQRLRAIWNTGKVQGWLPEGMGWNFIWRRGFIQRIEGPLHALRQYGPAIARREPVEGCVVTDRNPEPQSGDVWTWHEDDGEHPTHMHGGSPLLPPALFEKMAASDFGNVTWHYSEAEARAALNAAVWREIVGV